MLSAFLPLRELDLVPFPLLKDCVLLRGEEKRSRLHLAFPPSLSKALKCLWCSQNIREHEQGRSRGPPTPDLWCGKGGLIRLTPIRRVTRHRTAKSHPSWPPPPSACPTCSQRAAAACICWCSGSRGRERGQHLAMHVPVGCPLPLFRDPRRNFRVGCVTITKNTIS